MKKRRDVVFATKPDEIRKKVSSPLFESCRLISEHCLQINSYQVSIDLCKPIQIGAAILELSKCTMYNFYYNELVPVLKDKDLQMLYTDTDSLIISFRSKTMENDLSNLKMMDYSNFHDKHPLYNDDKKAALFHMKIEMAGHEIIGFVALKAKCYALLIKPNKTQLKYEQKNGIKHGFSLNSSDNPLGQVIKCKGVNKAAANSLNFLQYYTTLKTEETTLVSFDKLQSNNHIIHRVKQTKVALNSLDDKRYILDCNCCSFAYESELIQRYAKEISISCDQIG